MAAASRLISWPVGAFLILASSASFAELPADVEDTELAELRNRIEAGEADAAAIRLRRLASAEPHNADIYTLLGFAYRHLGDREAARRAYDRALALDPDHIGAREYLGEMEAEIGRMAEARQHLQALERLCPQGCEELMELRAAIAQRE